MTILLFKSIHIIGFVAWFAGLFYLVRMFVYHVESENKPQPDRDILTAQFALMERRVYGIICNPAMTITWIAGLSMIYLYGMEWFKANTWLHIKLILLVLLTLYHLWCGRLIKKLDLGESQLSSFQFRLANEVPTLFLFAIVFLASYRNLGDASKIFGLVLLVGIFLFLGAKFYKKIRNNKST